MPRIPSDHLAKFLAYAGASHTLESVDPTTLIPVQKELGPGEMAKLLAKPRLVEGKRAVVSSDDKILDGHHRWAHSLLRGEKLDVVRVHMPMNQLLPLAQKYTDEAGLERLHANAFCPTGGGGGVDPTCSPGGASPHSVSPHSASPHAPADTDVVLGDVPVERAKFAQYLRKNGKEWPAQKLPNGVEPGTPKECFKNATLTALAHGYDYCEGVGYIPSMPGLAFLHAWCIDKQGKVVDPTWEHPEDCKYFGVKYDKKAYMQHITKTGMYGVFGGKASVARQVIERGGL